MDATTLVRRLLSAARGRRRPAPLPAQPAATVCERCGMLVDTACWHRHCPLTRSHPR